MTSASHPRFRLLIGWCCLMSSALLIVIIYISYKNGKPNFGNKESNSSEIKGTHAQQIGHHPGPFFNDHMRLIRDTKDIWICHPCKNSSFSQKNNTVNITVSGLYSFHAQVTFITSNNQESQLQGSIALRLNKVPGRQERILSRVRHPGPGTATMICHVELKVGDSISLDIEPNNSISGEAWDTYWEILFLNKRV